MSSGPGAPPTGLAAPVLASAGWLFTRRLSANVIRLVAVAILARQLAPAEFGLAALAGVLVQFVTLVGEGGTGTYVIYDRAEGRGRRVQAAFWLNLAISMLQCGLCLAAIPFATRLFPHPQLGAVLAALVAVFFVRQLAVVPDALVQRDLRHPLLAKRDMVLDLAGAALSVLLAVQGAGVWSLVVPSLALQPVSLVVALRAARWRPALPMETGQWRRVLRYTAPLMGSRVLSLVTNDGDTLLVGRLLGTTVLGFYSMAWQLANLVGRNITAVVWSVTMPALARVRDDAERLRSAYLRMIGFLGIVCLPLLAGMAALAEELVRAVYGEGWEPAVTLLRIFVLFTLVRSLTSPSSMVYNVMGRPDIGFKFTLAFTPVYVAAILVGSRWGAAGIAGAVSMVRTGGALVDLHLAARLIDLPLRRVAAVLQGAAGLSVLLAALAWATAGLLGAAGVGPFLRLIAATAVGGGAYVAGLVVRRPAGYEDVARAFRATRGSLQRRWSRCLRKEEPVLVGGERG